MKLHIGMGLNAESNEDKSLDIQIRIAEIDAEYKKMIASVSADSTEDFDEARLTEIMVEKQELNKQLERYRLTRQKQESAKSRLDQICLILDGIQNHPMEYDDQLVRQMLDCVVVESKERIKVVFAQGVEVTEELP